MNQVLSGSGTKSPVSVPFFVSFILSLYLSHLMSSLCSHILCPTWSLSSSPSRLSLCRAELQASDSRYQAQRRITQLLQTELLQLYSRVEMEAPASTATSSPPGGRADPHTRADSRSGSALFTTRLSYRSAGLRWFPTFMACHSSK